MDNDKETIGTESEHVVGAEEMARVSGRAVPDVDDTDVQATDPQAEHVVGAEEMTRMGGQDADPEAAEVRSFDP